MEDEGYFVFYQALVLLHFPPSIILIGGSAINFSFFRKYFTRMEVRQAGRYSFLRFLARGEEPIAGWGPCRLSVGQRLRLQVDRRGYADCRYQAAVAGIAGNIQVYGRKQAAHRNDQVCYPWQADRLPCPRSEPSGKPAFYYTMSGENPGQYGVRRISAPDITERNN